MSGIAIIDLETTGLTRLDRIVEIGVVLVNPEGEIEGEFTTLVDPARDIGAGHIHGITASDLISAPTFVDVAPYLTCLLSGRVAVAHNASFDLTFLAREFARAGHWFPEQTPAVCTMRMSSAVLGGIRGLDKACEYLSIPNPQHHAALSDARAAAELLRLIVWEINGPATLPGGGVFEWVNDTGRLLGSTGGLSAFIYDAQRAWPVPETVSPPAACTRDAAALHNRQADGRLARLVRNLPSEMIEATCEDAITDYLGLLDQVLLDRFVTIEETETLASAIDDWGLGTEEVMIAHRRYLQSLAHAALRDGVVTAVEREDLERACLLLGLPSSEVDQALSAASNEVEAEQASGLTLSVGDRVCFTGTMSVPRSALEAMAISAGLVPGGVTKKTAALVAADPNSRSGKASKAANYGIPIVSEQVFLYALDRLSRQVP